MEAFAFVEFCTPTEKHKHLMALDVGLDIALGGPDFRLIHDLLVLTKTFISDIAKWDVLLLKNFLSEHLT